MTEPQRKVRRDHAWIEREYNQEKYARVLTAVREVIAAGESDLARLIGHVTLRERRDMTVAMHKEVVIDSQLVHAPLLFASGGVAHLTVEAMAAACRDDTDMVVELGAGWGRNLFQLHLSGQISNGTRLLALEYAETARMAGTLVAASCPHVPFAAAAFDYHAPDYSIIPGSDAHTLVATIHSVEQIPELRAEVILKLLERRPCLSGVHLEPVSFQIPADKRAMRPALTSAAYAEKNDYNRNFWRLLTELEAQGAIEIEDVTADICGLNIQNPSTLIFWRSKRAASR